MMRIDIGIDPGLSGAVAVLADGEGVAVHDMPVREVDGKREVDGMELAGLIRDIRRIYPGADFAACIETVFAMGRGKDGAGGAAAMQCLGDARGCARGVLEALGVPYTRAASTSWKRSFGLIGQGKDASRQAALRLFPGLAGELKRKKDDGRAEALLIAKWAYSRHMTGE